MIRLQLCGLLLARGLRRAGGALAAAANTSSSSSGAPPGAGEQQRSAIRAASSSASSAPPAGEDAADAARELGLDSLPIPQLRGEHQGRRHAPAAPHHAGLSQCGYWQGWKSDQQQPARPGVRQQLAHPHTPLCCGACRRAAGVCRASRVGPGRAAAAAQAAQADVCRHRRLSGAAAAAGGRARHVRGRHAARARAGRRPVGRHALQAGGLRQARNTALGTPAPQQQQRLPAAAAGSGAASSSSSRLSCQLSRLLHAPACAATSMGWALSRAVAFTCGARGRRRTCRLSSWRRCWRWSRPWATTTRAQRCSSRRST